MNAEEIKQQYLKLRELYYKMKGRTYPVLMHRALKDLCDEYKQAGGKDVLPDCDPPDEFGYAPKGGT